MTTEYFLDQMSAEDLEGGDMEYIEWAGEAKLLTGLASELNALDHVRLVLLENIDLDSTALSTNPQFVEVIERAQSRHKSEGEIFAEAMRRRLKL